MTNERAGQLNEPNLMDECITSSVNKILENYRHPPIPTAIRATIEILRDRGLINELGIEVLKRDGVIK